MKGYLDPFSLGVFSIVFHFGEYERLTLRSGAARRETHLSVFNAAFSMEAECDCTRGSLQQGSLAASIHSAWSYGDSSCHDLSDEQTRFSQLGKRRIETP